MADQLRQAAQIALEALDSDNPDIQLRAALTLRTALEQQQVGPVACRFCHSERGCWTWQCYHCGEIDDVQKPTQPVAQPEQQAEPFSAVSIHATQTAWKMGYEAAKAEMQPEQEPCIGKDPRCPCQDGDACHYKDCGNSMARPVAQPEQEPVAWAVQGITQMIRGEFAELDAKSKAKRIGGTCVAYPLYTAPPQRSWVGLTDEEKKKIATVAGCTDNDDGHIVTEIFRLAEIQLKERNT